MLKFPSRRKRLVIAKMEQRTVDFFSQLIAFLHCLEWMGAIKKFGGN
jgi:hypothetical protein